MSTDRKRLTSAVQRIAREDSEIRKLLDDFRNSGGKPSEGATTGSGAEDRQICCDGGTSDSTNPGSDTRDTGDGGQDGLGDDPANLDDMGGGSLTGVTDCATGVPICFQGSDCIPPPGWDDCKTPGVELQYTEGYYFNSVSYGRSVSFQYQVDQAEPVGGNYSGEYEITFNDNGDGTGVYGVQFLGTSGTVTKYFSVAKSKCPEENDPVLEAVCGPDVEPPLVDEFPPDGCVNLYIAGGKIVGSKFDPENDGSYSAPRDEVELCDSFGNSFKLSASGSIEGGFKSISGTSVDGYLYDSKGKNVARISGSEYSDPRI